LTTSQLVPPLQFSLAPLRTGAKRKFLETGFNPPTTKRITLADRVAAPKNPASKPVTRSVSASVAVVRPAARNPILSSTVGPGGRPPPVVRPVAQPRSRIPSGGAGFSKSVGMGNKTPRKREESERPVSRDGVTKTPGLKAKRPAWDTKGRLEDMELAYLELKEKLEGSVTEKENVSELLTSERARCRLLRQRGLIGSVGIGDESCEAAD
jgi:hypothetical protein